MDYDSILDKLAPCGLNCGKCMFYINGDIQEHAAELKRLLGDNFDKYAERFTSFMPEFKDYPAFRDLLSHMTQGDCKGCRNGTCRYPNCGVTECYREKGVDFCFQCDEFPCSKTNFDPDLHQRWLTMNRRMREIGVEAYYDETGNDCRYV